MTRALFFADTPHRLAGGQRSLIAALSVIHEADIVPTVVVPSDGILADACRRAGLAVVVLAAPPAFHAFGRALTRKSIWSQAGIMLRQVFPYARRLARLIDDLRADVIHVNSPRAAIMAGAAAPLSGRNAVLHVRGSAAMEFRYWLMAQAVANRFVLVSHALRSELLPALRRRACVVYNGVQILPAIEREAARRDVGDRFGLALANDSAPVFLSLSSPVAFKGLHHLLDAAAETKRLGLDAHFLLAGTGVGDPYERWLHNRREVLGLRDCVHFLGFVEDTHALLCASDALICPTITRERLALDDGTRLEVRCAEGLPRCILEAMAAERPVIASDFPGVSEQVSDGLTGVLVPSSDARSLAEAIRRVAGDASWREQAGRRGREIVRERFTIAGAATGLAEALRTAAGEKGRLARPLEYAAFCRDGLVGLMRSLLPAR